MGEGAGDFFYSSCFKSNIPGHGDGPWHMVTTEKQGIWFVSTDEVFDKPDPCAKFSPKSYQLSKRLHKQVFKGVTFVAERDFRFVCLTGCEKNLSK
jgi:hypothetical protein